MRLRRVREERAEPCSCVVESRPSRARGNADQLGDFHERQPDIVVQHEHRTLLDGEAQERPFQLVTISDRRRGVGQPVVLTRQDGNEGGPTRASSVELVVAGVNKDPMDPGLETVWVSKLGQAAPGKHEGVLQRVLRESRIAQNPKCDRVERIADLMHQDGKRFTIGLTGLFDKLSVHLDLRVIVAAEVAANYPL